MSKAFLFKTLHIIKSTTKVPPATVRLHPVARLKLYNL